MRSPESLLTEIKAEIAACTLDDSDEQKEMVNLLNRYASEVGALDLPKPRERITRDVAQARAEYNACRALAGAV